MTSINDSRDAALLAFRRNRPSAARDQWIAGVAGTLGRCAKRLGWTRPGTVHDAVMSTGAIALALDRLVARMDQDPDAVRLSDGRLCVHRSAEGHLTVLLNVSYYDLQWNGGGGSLSVAEYEELERERSGMRGAHCSDTPDEVAA